MSARTARNVAIILAIAAAVALLPGGWFTAGLTNWALGVFFYGLLGWLASRMYREHRIAIYSLGDGPRAAIYAAVGVAVVVAAATHRLWQTGPGTLAWILLIGACAMVVMAALQASRRLS